MKVTFLKSATVIVEAGGKRVLMDPWLVDGEYYGSWAHVPPFDWQRHGHLLESIDYIYISHVHPDHVSRKTMERLPKQVPVLIHRYEDPFLKRIIEQLGFGVRELPHNQRFDLGGRAEIAILAADHCNPELCGRFFGCGAIEARYGSTQIDSLAVVTDGQHTLVNANDCPYELSKAITADFVETRGPVDFLLMGYSGAGCYPQCFPNLSSEERLAAAEAKKAQFLRQGEQYIRDLRPRWFMPFAGTYALSGRYAELNDLRGVPLLSEAFAYYSASQIAEQAGARCLLLDSGGSFDFADETVRGWFRAMDPELRRRYIEEDLATRTYEFDEDPLPQLCMLTRLLPACYARMERRRKAIGFSSRTNVYVPLVNGRSARIPMDGSGCAVVDAAEKRSDPAYVEFTVDPRLLARILRSPRLAHWNNASLGSHIRYDRRPDRFERGLYHVMNFFHA